VELTISRHGICAARTAVTWISNGKFNCRTAAGFLEGDQLREEDPEKCEEDWILADDWMEQRHGMMPGMRERVQGNIQSPMPDF